MKELQSLLFSGAVMPKESQLLYLQVTYPVHHQLLQISSRWSQQGVVE